MLLDCLYLQYYPTGKIQTVINMLGTNLPLCQNFQYMFDPNGLLHQIFLCTFDAHGWQLSIIHCVSDPYTYVEWCRHLWTADLSVERSEGQVELSHSRVNLSAKQILNKGRKFGTSNDATDNFSTIAYALKFCCNRSGCASGTMDAFFQSGKIVSGLHLSLVSPYSGLRIWCIILKKIDQGGAR